MAKHQNIVRRGSRWVYRRRVPDKLRPIVGRHDIRVSLRTGDFQEAPPSVHGQMKKGQPEWRLPMKLGSFTSIRTMGVNADDEG